MSGRGKEMENICEAWLRGTGACWFRNEPTMRGGYRMSGGTPDYTALQAGIMHLIECKDGSGPSLRLGCCEAPAGQKLPPAGITPAQAATLDACEREGGRGWILARLTGPQGQVTALVPWRVWRGWLLAGLRSVPPEWLAGAGDAAWDEGRLPLPGTSYGTSAAA